MNKPVPPEQLLNLAGEVISRGGHFAFNTTGHSMYPAIAHGDRVVLGPLPPGGARVGDVVLVGTGDGPRLHRVVSTGSDSAGPFLLTRGDAELGGGRIIGEGVHFIDFLVYLIGEVPTQVSAQALPDNGRYLQDNVVLNFTFPDGSVGVVSYLANGDKAVAKERVEAFSGGRVAMLDDFRSLEMVANGNRKIVRNRLRQDKGHKRAGRLWIVT